MATVKFRQFIQPGILMAIAPDRLVSLFFPYREYFNRRGFFFPGELSGPINYAKLSAILVDPDDQVPSNLVDALYFITEMANIKTADGLVAAAKSAYPDMTFSPLATAADIVVQVWLKDPDLVAKRHAASLINKPKSFEYHISRDPRPQIFAMPTPETIQTMESAMDDWFEQNRRGRNCGIIIADHGDRISFLIRHGRPMQREGSIKNGESGSIWYRPEVFDVVVYDRLRDELGVRASGTKGEKQLYREVIGLYMFGDRDYFPGRQKFTLEPLAINGVAALVCSDIDGLDQVTLTAFEKRLNDGFNGIDFLTSDDIFLTMAEQNKPMPPASDLTQAVFSLKFAKRKRPRSLTIRLPNHAMYQRDEDSILIDQWLTKRGFITDLPVG